MWIRGLAQGLSNLRRDSHAVPLQLGTLGLGSRLERSGKQQLSDTAVLTGENAEGQANSGPTEAAEEPKTSSWKRQQAASGVSWSIDLTVFRNKLVPAWNARV